MEHSQQLLLFDGEMFPPIQNQTQRKVVKTLFKLPIFGNHGTIVVPNNEKDVDVMVSATHAAELEAVLDSVNTQIVEPPVEAPTSRYTAGSVMVTPSLANHWINNYRYAGQRDIKPHRVADLAQKMRNGEFTHGSVAFAVCDGEQHLVNGQHTLMAIIESKASIPTTVEHIPADTMHDVAVLYGTFDVQAKRSVSDQLSPFGLTEQLGLTRSQIDTLRGSVLFIHFNFSDKDRNKSYPLMTAEKVAPMIERWADAAKLYFAIAKKIPARSRRSAQRSGVLSVILCTLCNRDPLVTVKASAFWSRVLTMDNLKRGTTPHTLGAYLDETVGNNMKPDELARKVAHAWNAFYLNRNIGRIILPKDSLTSPVRIMGTPWEKA